MKNIFFPFLFFIIQSLQVSIAQKADGGNGHSIILDKNGKVWTIGRNNHGQLGNGTFINSSIPVKIETLPPIKFISRGYDHNIAIDKTGCIWTWGLNNYGQLGVGLPMDYPAPVKLKWHSGFVAVAGGHWHTIALKSDGTVWAWGHNFYGELGIGDREHRDSPFQVLCTINDSDSLQPLLKIVEIKSVGYHTLALDIYGNVWSWGPNDFYQLGNQKKAIQPYAKKIEDIPKMKSIAVGWHHSIALDSSGNIWAWGSDPSGQFQESTTKFFPTPKKFDNLPEIKEIACGSWHSLAIDLQGNLWGWGKNHFGMLGTGDTLSTSFPIKIPGIKNVCKIGAGCFQSMAIDSNGRIWSFGDNPSGQLGLLNETRQFHAQPMLLNANGELDKEKIEKIKLDTALRKISMNNIYKFIEINPLFFLSIVLNITCLFIIMRIRKKIKMNNY